MSFVFTTETSRRPDVASQRRIHWPRDQEESGTTAVRQTRSRRPLSVPVRGTSGLQNDRLTSLLSNKWLIQISENMQDCVSADVFEDRGQTQVASWVHCGWGDVDCVKQ